MKMVYILRGWHTDIGSEYVLRTFVHRSGNEGILLMNTVKSI